MKDSSVTIREVRLEDGAIYVSWLIDPRLQDWHGGADAEREFQRVLRSKFNFVVEFAAVPVGTVAVEGNWGHGTSAELGIMMEPAHQRKGLGSRAVALALDFAFGESGVHRVWAGVVGDNEPALRFFRHVGFVEEGRAREARFKDRRWWDHVYFSVLEREWTRQRDMALARG